MQRSTRLRHARCALILSAAIPTVVCAGTPTLDLTKSTTTLTFDPDLNGGSQLKTVTGNPPVVSGSMSSYQLNQTFTSGTASSTATGSIGYVLNATTATFTLKAGSGVSQTDPNNVYTGASDFKINFDGWFNPTSPSFGPVATGYVSVAIGGVAGANGYAYFRGQIDFLDGNTNAPLRPQVNFGAETFSNGASSLTFAKSYTSSALLGLGSVAVGTPIRVKGFFQFRASNEDTPSNMSPFSVDIGSAPPTATWAKAGGDWGDPNNWAPSATDFVEDIGNTIPTIPDGPGVRARFIPFQDVSPTILLGNPRTLGALDFDSRNTFTIGDEAGAALTLNALSSNATVQVRNSTGSNSQNLNAPVLMADPIDFTTDASYFGPKHPKTEGDLNVSSLNDGSASLGITKFGGGRLTFNGPNTYDGGTVINAGTLTINAAGGLGTGSVVINGGALEINVPNASLNNATITANAGGQIALNNTPTGAEHFIVNNGGMISGNAAALSALSVGGNVALAPGALIGHTEWNPLSASGNPIGLGGSPQFIYAISSDVFSSGDTHAIIVGSASGGPWSGFGSDNADQSFGTTVSSPDELVQLAGDADFTVLSHTLSFNGLIQSIGGPSSLTKRGAGALLLASSPNSVSGAVHVAQGALYVDGALTGTAATVDAGATIGGGGTINMPVTLSNDAILEPGSNDYFGQIGALNIIGGLTMASTSHLNFELGKDNDGTTVNDLIIVNGDLTLDGLLDITDDGLFGPGTYTLLEVTGNINNLGLLMGNVPVPDGFGYHVSIVSDLGGMTDVILGVTAIPEPAALGAILLTCSSMIRRRRR